MVGDTDSTLAKSADLVLDVGVDQEACPLGLAPTASTTASMALGDALALCLSEKRGFHLEDFARLHPGGRLGKKLAKVEELMHRGEKIPKVTGETGMDAVIYEMSKKGLGITSVPLTISQDEFATAALHLMEQKKITSLMVTDASEKVVGVIHLHDLWGTEMF
jgi:arabinose-5-phosphate isomerase